MPSAPPRPCPSCHRLITGRCPRCTRRRDQARGSAQARGYDTAWTVLAKRWLARFPWCGQRVDGQLHATHSVCAGRGLKVPAACVDHIVSLRQGGERLDLHNLQSLCTSCNLRKGG